MRLPLRRKGIFPMGGGVTVETTSAIVPAPVLLLLLLKRVSGKVLRAASADAMASTVTLPSVELPLALLLSTSKILVGLGVEAKGEVDGGGGGGGQRYGVRGIQTPPGFVPAVFSVSVHDPIRQCRYGQINFCDDDDSSGS